MLSEGDYSRDVPSVNIRSVQLRLWVSLRPAGRKCGEIFKSVLDASGLCTVSLKESA